MNNYLTQTIHPMQNEKGLVAMRAKTRLAGPRKNGRLMRRAPNFKICRQIVVFPTVPKKLYRTENGKKIFYFKFPDDVNQHLAHLFYISQSTVSRIFLSWINYLYLKFGQVSIWANKEVVRATMPDSVKGRYSSTRVIIDCTEIRCQMPSSLLLNSKLFSSYKNHVTLKGLYN